MRCEVTFFVVSDLFCSFCKFGMVLFVVFVVLLHFVGLEWLVLLFVVVLLPLFEFASCGLLFFSGDVLLAPLRCQLCPKAAPDPREG